MQVSFYVFPLLHECGKQNQILTSTYLALTFVLYSIVFRYERPLQKFDLQFISVHIQYVGLISPPWSNIEIQWCLYIGIQKKNAYCIVCSGIWTIGYLSCQSLEYLYLVGFYAFL